LSESERSGCQTPCEIVHAIKNVGGSQWMLAFNEIMKCYLFTHMQKRNNEPNLIVSIHWLPPTVLYCDSDLG